MFMWAENKQTFWRIKNREPVTSRLNILVVSNILYFYSYLGKILNLTHIFHGLKPPTRYDPIEQILWAN